MPRLFFQATLIAAAAALGCALASTALFASSHREAPFITELPKVDGTDFYMFRSYGPDSTDDSITLIANYQPLQDAYGGPNYFTMDPNALYEIHVDNNGDTREDITFQFRFETTFRSASLPIGPEDDQGNPTDVPIALSNVGPARNTSTVGPNVNDNAGLNVVENYRVTVVRGDRRSSTNPPEAINPSTTGDDTLFRKPVDNIGEKTIPNYPTYARNHIFNISIPGCTQKGRVFVGQRRDGFVVNLGEVFDRINLVPTAARDSRANILDDKNITSLALEIPRSCLLDPVAVAQGETPEPVLGAWTTASLRQARVLNPLPLAPGQVVNDTPDNPAADNTSIIARDGETNTPAVQGGPWTQVSRLGNPLVNEVIIGLNQKDQFNASEPFNDLLQFGTFVTHPTLPALIETLFDVPAPATPRLDLVAAFITGIRTPVGGTLTNFTQPQNITDTNLDMDDSEVIEAAELVLGGEMLRLNTTFPAGPLPEKGAQDSLGFLACDLYGFPNGRRPIDDVVDIELTVAEGALTANNPNTLQTCDLSAGLPGTVVNGGTVINDGALPQASDYLPNFPYLSNPLPGSPIAASRLTQ